MEELLRQAFQLGQQWVQDMNNDKEPQNFNEWYASDEVQQQVKNCSIPAVSGRSEQLIDFAIKNGYIEDMPKGNKMGLIDKFEKSINCH